MYIFSVSLRLSKPWKRVQDFEMALQKKQDGETWEICLKFCIFFEGLFHTPLPTLSFQQEALPNRSPSAEINFSFCS